MDSSGKNKLETCAHYLNSKTILLASRSHDPVLQQHIHTCLRQVYKEPFVKNLILPFNLFAAEELASQAAADFEQAMVLFFEHIRNKQFKPEKNNAAPYLFLLLKHAFLEHLTQMLWDTRQKQSNTSETTNASTKETAPTGMVRDVTRRTATVLAQLPQERRDYFIWYYVDGFTISQIGTITGLAAEEVKEHVWGSREIVSRTWKQVFAFPNSDILARAQYSLFCEYFENSLSGENERLFREVLQESSALQENFEHELYLRFGVDKTTLLAQLSQGSREPFQTADEFIAWVKNMAGSS